MSRIRNRQLILALLVPFLSGFASVVHAASEPVAATQSTPVPAPAAFDLPAALRYALDHNYAILEARERIREQDGVILQVKSALLPRASVDAQYIMQDKALGANLASPDTTQNMQDWSLGITVTQLLYAGGGPSATTAAQKSLREAALLDLESVINAALLDVRTRFYNALLAREQIKVQEENLNLLEEQHTIAKNRYDAGAASSFDVLRAQVSIANAKPTLIRARNAYRNALDQLRRSLGYATEQTTATTAGGTTSVSSAPAPSALQPFSPSAFSITGTLDAPPATYDLAASIAAALENRPELKRLARLTDAGESAVIAAKSGYKPTVAVFGNYTIERNMTYGYNPAAPSITDINLNNFGHQINGWNLGVQGSWAVFDGRATAGKVAQARSRLDQTRLQTSDAALAIEVEVRQSYNALQEAAELVDAAQKVTAQAEEALRLANSRYSAGTATQLDVLTTQVALTETRLNQLQANYSYVVAVASLRKATGQADQIVSGN